MTKCFGESLIDRVNTVITANRTLHKQNYTWDEQKRTFKTAISDLTLDFRGFDDMVIKVGHRCIIRCDNNCTLHSGDWCIFDTYANCVFETGDNCVFDATNNCVFRTGRNCTFIVDRDNIFETEKGALVRRRSTSEITLLDYGENCYDQEDDHIVVEQENFDIIIFRNCKRLNFKLEFCNKEDLQILKQFMSEEDYGDMLKTIFNRMT